MIPNFWKRTSERNLLFLIYDPQTDQLKKQEAFNEFKQRLNKLLHATIQKNEWKSLYFHQDDIIDETITRLTAYYSDFRGNSWGYRRYIQKVMKSVCANLIKEEIIISISLDDLLNDVENGEGSVTMREIIGTYFSIHPNWIQNNDSIVLTPPEMMIEEEECYNIVLQARMQLSKRCQEFLHREDDLEQPQEEIAKEMEMKHGTVRVNISRCRQQLMRQIILLLSQQDAELQQELIESTISELPDPQRTVIASWWEGKSNWSHLGQLFDPPLSQKKTKQLFAKGLSETFTYLSKLNTAPKEA